MTNEGSRRVKRRYGMGWLHEIPDHRDFAPEHPAIAPLLSRLNVPDAKADELPESVDLRSWCSPIEDQGELGSCTAQAAVGLVEYYERRVMERHIEGSRRFVYKVSRNLLGFTGDTGAYLRTAMAALALFGLPPEQYWPYTVRAGTGPNGFDAEPPAFCYAFALSFKAVRYYRLDPCGYTRPQVLDMVRVHLAAGLPVMFGFSAYASIHQAQQTGEIPFPGQKDQLIGGHAVAAVGYDDQKTIASPSCTGTETGAFLIRNSWGTDWGDEGYGWLPYRYLLEGLAIDWWTLISNDLVDICIFGL